MLTRKEIAEQRTKLRADYKLIETYPHDDFALGAYSRAHTAVNIEEAALVASEWKQRIDEWEKQQAN